MDTCVHIWCVCVCTCVVPYYNMTQCKPWWQGAQAILKVQMKFISCNTLYPNYRPSNVYSFYNQGGQSSFLRPGVRFIFNWSLGSNQPRASTQCPRVSVATVHPWCLGGPHWSPWHPPLADSTSLPLSPTSSRKPLQTTLPSLSLGFLDWGQWPQIRLPASPSPAGSEPMVGGGLGPARSPRNLVRMEVQDPMGLSCILPQMPCTGHTGWQLTSKALPVLLGMSRKLLTVPQNPPRILPCLSSERASLLRQHGPLPSLLLPKSTLWRGGPRLTSLECLSSPSIWSLARPRHRAASSVDVG